MENLECPQCGNALIKGVAVCGSCGKEIKDDKITLSAQNMENKPGSKKLYAILAVLLVLLGGAALLIITGVLPNPLKSYGAVAAIVNGEKIFVSDVDQQLKLKKNKFWKKGRSHSNDPDDLEIVPKKRMSVLNRLINDKILETEAAKANITVSPQEIADIKKSYKISDKDFEALLKQRGKNMADFEKQIGRGILTQKLIAESGKEKGVPRSDWFEELKSRAKVEVLMK